MCRLPNPNTCVARAPKGTDLRAEFHTQAGETVALRGATVASGSQMALRFDAANQCFWLEPVEFVVVVGFKLHFEGSCDFFIFRFVFALGFDF